MCVSPLTFLEWLSVAKSRRRRSGSMAITKKSGERGSPCRRPLTCISGVQGTSLSKTCGCVSHSHEIVMDASLFSKCTLCRRHYGLHVRSKS